MTDDGAVSEHDEDGPPRQPADATPEPVTAEIVPRDAPLPLPPARRWPETVATFRSRLPELARHPAVVATATALGTSLATTIASGVARHAVRAAIGRQAPPAVRGLLIAHVDVVHHVVHHVTSRPLPPGGPVD